MYSYFVIIWLLAPQLIDGFVSQHGYRQPLEPSLNTRVKSAHQQALNRYSSSEVASLRRKMASLQPQVIQTLPEEEKVLRVQDGSKQALELAFNTRVKPAYEQAVKTFSGKILGFIASVPPQDIQNLPEDVLGNLKCNIKQLNDELETATAGVDSIRKESDASIQANTLKISTFERALVLTRKEENIEARRLSSINSQLVTTRAQLNSAQKSVQAAENDVKWEEERYRKARESCIGKRRKRESASLRRTKRDGFLKKIWRKVTKPVEKVLCKTFNRKGIKNARKGLNRARASVKTFQTRYTSLSNQLYSTNANLNSIKKQMNVLAVQKSRIQSDMAKQISQRNEITSFGAKLKGIQTHVSTLVGKNEVLKDIASKLIDFETLVDPMKSLSNAFGKFHQTLSTESLLNIPSGTMEKFKKHIQQLIQRAPDYPFVIDDNPFATDC